MNDYPKTDMVIWGASDDLVQIAGPFREEYLAYDGMDLRITEQGNPEAGCIVRMRCVDDGVWQAAICLLGEGCVIPWSVEVGSHPTVAYSVRVRIVECGQVDVKAEARS